MRILKQSAVKIAKKAAKTAKYSPFKCTFNKKTAFF